MLKVSLSRLRRDLAALARFGRTPSGGVSRPAWGPAHEEALARRVATRRGLRKAGMIFIPSKGGRSHRPDEASDWWAIERGANVLLHTLLTLAR